MFYFNPFAFAVTDQCPFLYNNNSHNNNSHYDNEQVILFKALTQIHVCVWGIPGVSSTFKLLCSRRVKDLF